MSPIPVALAWLELMVDRRMGRSFVTETEIQVVDPAQQEQCPDGTHQYDIFSGFVGKLPRFVLGWKKKNARQNNQTWITFQCYLECWNLSWLFQNIIQNRFVWSTNCSTPRCWLLPPTQSRNHSIQRTRRLIHFSIFGEKILLVTKTDCTFSERQMKTHLCLFTFEKQAIHIALKCITRQIHMFWTVAWFHMLFI